MRLRFASLIAALILGVCCWTTAAAQAPYAPGAVIGLQGTPHLFVVGDDGLLHWAGDTRALQGRWVVWSNRYDVTLAELQVLPRGDPWLSAGLVKEGDPIYLVKWETTDVYPTLLHIQSIADVELFGINGSNYGYFVRERQEWEQIYQLSLDGVARGQLPPLAGGAGTPAPTPIPSGELQRLTLEQLRNAAYHVPLLAPTEPAIQLQDGQAALFYGDAPAGGIWLGDQVAFGDLDGDHITDAAVIVFYNGGGSGTFISLVTVLDRDGAPMQGPHYLLGDRVVVQNVTISHGEIVVDMLTHGPEDALCCPTQAVTRKYVPFPPERTIIFVAGLGTAMSSWSYKDTPFQGIHNALANAGVSYSHYNFSYSGGPDYSCEQSGQPLGVSGGHLTDAILAAREHFPDNRVTLIGHSLGGLLSYLQLYAVETGAIPAGTIENIITLDAPLHGSGRLRAALAGIFASYCKSQATSSEAAETIKAIKDAGVSWQQELTRLAHVGRDNGIEVFTIGNTHDCVYNPLNCDVGALTNYAAYGVCLAAGGWWCLPLLGTFGATAEDNSVSQIVQSQFNRHWLGNFGRGDGSLHDSHSVVRRHSAVLDAIVQAVLE